MPFILNFNTFVLRLQITATVRLQQQKSINLISIMKTQKISICVKGYYEAEHGHHQRAQLAIPNKME